MGQQHEQERVELPFIAQLKGLGWTHITGDTRDPKVTERSSFREVILVDRLRKALRDINLDAAGKPWLDDARIEQAIHDLQRPLGGLRLMEANEKATDLLLGGTAVAGDPERGHDREQPVRYIDFAEPFYNILVEEAGDAAKERLDFFEAVTIELVDAVRQELRIVDFWRNVTAQNILRRTILDLLDPHQIVPYAKMDALVDRLMLLAKALHERLRA